MNSEFLTTIFKNKNNLPLYIILIIGVVLMLFSGHKTDTPTISPKEPSQQEELSKILSAISGAGETKVMITYYGSGTSNIVYDTKTRGSDTDRTAVVSDGKAVTAGESYPRVKGVVVVAEGAKNSAVSRAITDAVMVSLDVPEYKVAVFAGN